MDGRHLTWSPSHPRPNPLLVGDEVGVGGFSSTLVALDAGTGEVRRRQALREVGVDAPICAQLAYVRTCGVLYALEPRTFADRWRLIPSGQREPPLASATLAGGWLYIGDKNGWMYALDAATGVPRWTHHAERILTTALVRGGLVYFVSERTALALVAETGRVVWTSPLAAVSVQQVSALRDEILFADAASGTSRTLASWPEARLRHHRSLHAARAEQEQGHHDDRRRARPLGALVRRLPATARHARRRLLDEQSPTFVQASFDGDRLLALDENGVVSLSRIAPSAS